LIRLSDCSLDTSTLMHFDLTLLDTLRCATHIAVFTGAGVSAESGVPTVRDAQTGVWKNLARKIWL
jgi:NAD-dependent SIR2 family protein deacetylase